MVTKSRYVAAFSLAIIIFSLGIFIGNLTSQYKISELENNIAKLSTKLIGLELKDKLTTFNCNLSWEYIWKEKVDMGRYLESLEERLGKKNSQVLLQKEVYELIEIRTLLLLKKLKTDCNENFSIILYFYSNDKKDEKAFKESENQGYILDSIFSKYPDKMKILSFDIDIENPAVNSLIETYSINEAPSLIIDDKLYEGFQSLEELKRLLNLD